MKNFEFEHNGQKLWYSRSLACNLIILRYDPEKRDTFEVLACKRGQGCEFNKGLWNVPGGFIDFDENAKQCAIRECWEETGIKLPENQVIMLNVDTEPIGVRQTMVISHVAVFEKPVTEMWNFTTTHSEPDETEQIKWIDVRELDNYNWTRGQKMNIWDAIGKYNWILKH